MLFLVSLPTRELPGVVLGFRNYLLDQFLRNGTDQRDKEIRG